MTFTYTPPSFTYLGDYSNWDDVAKSYGITMPEPEEVFMAYLGLDSFGFMESYVFYRIGKQYYHQGFIYPSTQEFPKLNGKWKPRRYHLAGFMKHLVQIENDLMFDDDENEMEYDMAMAVRVSLTKKLGIDQ